jgi:Flp pilus assembly protein TadG
MIAFPKRLRRDTRGATLIEFAIVAPVMIVLIMGMCELAYQAYVTSALVGALQKAGRDSAIQGNDKQGDSIDQKVMAMVRTVAAGATYTSKRSNYAQFGNIAPEYYFDTNNNGQYDAATECFMDVNGNGVWDADPGITGQGGANDVTVYSMTITYNRLFPVLGLFGWSSAKSLTATTVLKNQPYASQNAYTPTKVCP